MSTKEKEYKRTILQEATDIVYDRDQEKEREYGDFHESMVQAAQVANLTVKQQYFAMFGLKLSRLQHKWKYDSALDLIAYVTSYNDYVEKYGDI